MLKRFSHAALAAIRAFRADWRTYFQTQPSRLSRPVWDNGTNYNIPAYLRRRVG